MHQDPALPRLVLLGAEIRLERLLAAWRTPVFGLVLQVAASVANVGLIGAWADWTVGRTVLIGFAISLSSTAVVLRLLDDRHLAGTPLGNDILAILLAILLAQDLALAPMVVTIGLLGGGHPSFVALASNTLINAIILRLLGRHWGEAWLGGALLSQVGEFSFVLAAIGLEVGMITDQGYQLAHQGYQLALSVIATTLLFSAVWITLVSRLQPRDQAVAEANAV